MMKGTQNAVVPAGPRTGGDRIHLLLVRFSAGIDKYLIGQTGGPLAGMPDGSHLHTEVVFAVRGYKPGAPLFN